MEKVENGRQLVSVDKLEAPKVDVAVRGFTESESDIGAGSHHLLFNDESARLSLYLARQLSVFCKPMSEFICVTLL
jgi:hypothetical protein